MTKVRGRIQYGYSEKFAEFMYDEKSRKLKALRAIQIFNDNTSTPLKNQKCLTVGSATGIMSFFMADYFQEVIGIDIDRPALEYSKRNYSKENVSCFEMDALNTGFIDNSFDAVVCHHTYEHVSDSEKLIQEIYRILKPNGLLFFGAPNRLMLKESHYSIYFLSWWPKKISSLILKIMGKDDYYYETMRTYWGIKKLLSLFTDVQDYTLRCVREPDKYYSRDVIDEMKWVTVLPNIVLRLLLPFAPDFVFFARK